MSAMDLETTRMRSVSLIEGLRADLSGAKPLRRDDILHILENLKIIGRNPENISIFDTEVLNNLAKYADYKQDLQIRLEALRIIANALLVSRSLRQSWDGVSVFVDQYKNPTVDEEFVTGRIFFLSTIEEPRLYSQKTHQTLNEYITNSLHRHSGKLMNSKEQAAVVETCKLLFNILCKYSETASQYEHLVKYLVQALRHLPRELVPTTSSVVTCLLKLPATEETYFPKEEPLSVIALLFEMVESRMRLNGLDDPKLDDSIAPALLVLRSAIKSTNSTAVKDYVQSKILPSESERDKPLGTSSSFQSLLLQTASRPNLEKSRETIYQMMFEACDEDARKFISKIGYGFAAGFLINHKIAIPQDSLREAEEYLDSQRSVGINPVTGQRLDAELADRPSLAEMTDEEKEREAERLFVLFERLRENGVISAQNPVRTALESGRLEELPD
ncbi:guanine nucleotide exchange factor [Myxozyma melibiosi]|uniref:Guanine nucleotide exchange factor n=1 Tax=Myxozyma melibiosi TaxID=54550 RepID=A0ABR1F7R7_9ASCO